MAVQAAIPALGKSMSLRPSWATQEAGASLDYALRPCIKKEKKKRGVGDREEKDEEKKKKEDKKKKGEKEEEGTGREEKECFQK